MRLNKVFLLFILFLLTNHTTSSAAELDSAFIEHFTESYLIEKFPSTEEEKVQVSVSQLDPRIVIKPCSIPLTASLPETNNGRNVNIKISCNESIPWKIYLSARIEKAKAILIAKDTINKGDLLDDDNVELTFLAINKIRGHKITDKETIFGAKAKRRIAKGKAISKSNTCLVCKGDMVTIIASSESFSIKTQGVALSSGNINDQIRVKNTRSNNIITPRVKSYNQVIIDL